MYTNLNKDVGQIFKCFFHHICYEDFVQLGNDILETFHVFINLYIYHDIKANKNVVCFLGVQNSCLRLFKNSFPDKKFF